MDYQKLKGYGNLMALVGFLIMIIAEWNKGGNDWGYYQMYYDLHYLGQTYWQPYDYMVLLEVAGMIIAVMGIIMFTIGLIKSGKGVHQGAPAGTAPPYPQTPSYADYLCRKCEKQLTFIPAYSTWYCYNCRTYPGSEDMVDKRKTVDSDREEKGVGDESNNGKQGLQMIGEK